MKVILLVDIEGWGSVGDVRDVPAGAGAQHLVDEGLARAYSPEAFEDVRSALKEGSEFSLKVVEVRSRTVRFKAPSAEAALEAALDGFCNGDVVLTEDDVTACGPVPSTLARCGPIGVTSEDPPLRGEAR